MKKTMYELYSKREPVAAYGICNGFGLLVYRPLPSDDYNADEYLVTCYQVNGRLQNFGRNKVEWRGGRDFIRKGGNRFYLDEMLRVGLG